MSTIDLLNRLQSAAAGPHFDWNAARAEIVAMYRTAPERDRSALLEAYSAVMNAVERSGGLSAEDTEMFRTSRREEYNLMLVGECVRSDGNISPEALMIVTEREVAAGRMADDDELRQLAVGGLAAFAPEPHRPRRAFRFFGWGYHKG